MKMRQRRLLDSTILIVSFVFVAACWGQVPAPTAAAGFPKGPDVKFTPFVVINNGKYELDNADKGQLTGKVTNTEAKDIKITSSEGHLNPVYVYGEKSNFTLSDSTIEVSGNGADDFVAIGAGITANGGTTTVRNVKVSTQGVIRPAMVNTGNGVMKVYDSRFVAYGGTIPKDYKPVIGGGMMEPPAGLLIHGTARAALTMGKAKTYLYNTTIIAEGWGALSTDAAEDVYVECNKCDLQVNKSGYGSYADHGAHVVLNDTKLNAASYGGVIGGEARIDFNNVTGGAGANMVMIHSVMGKAADISRLNITGGKFVADYEALLIKSANADIALDGAEITSKLGTLIHLRKNEDAYATKVDGQKVTGVRVTMKNEKLEGNITNDDQERNMTLTFANSSLKGAINMAEVTLDAASKWMATGNSKVLLTGNVDVAKIDADKGVTIDAVCGKDCALKGSYNLASGGVLKIVEGQPKQEPKQ
jgi:hypothetical protein